MSYLDFISFWNLNLIDETTEGARLETSREAKLKTN